MQNSISDFEEIKEKGEKLYKEISKAYCPYFKEKILFNSQGLEHLKYKKRDRIRQIQDQYMRFKLLHLVPEILRLSHTLQGLLETKKFVKVRIHNRTDILLKSVNYYEFIALIKRYRLKIILKQIDNGEIFFWSIIPFWGMNKDTMTRLLHDGIPEED